MDIGKITQNSKNHAQQSNEFIIPKGYKGIRSTIKLQLNSNLGVITGLNGSGKTTLLKYIYEQYSDKKEIFFKTQKVEYFENERFFRRAANGYRSTSENPTFDDVYNEIIDFFKKNNRQPYTHHHEMFSMLFDDSSTLYGQGYIFLEKLADVILSKFDDPKNIRQRLGVPTEESIEKVVLKKINREIQEKVFKYPHSKGKNVYNLYKEKTTEPSVNSRIEGIVQETKTRLKEDCRKKSAIKDRNSFESYIFELISNNSFSVESIVQQLSRRIYEDAKAKGSRTRTKKLWEELNEELQKYRVKKQFNYNVIAPSIYSSSYEIAFTSGEGKEVHFDYLSSGEKIVFELVCYYFLSKSNNKNLKMIILDEFDANLNPALAEMYLSVVKEQFCNNGIVTLLTTHSPSTVVEVDPKDLFSVSIEDSKQVIACANNEEGKKTILKQLAPKFVYYGELGVLEYVLTDKNNTIIFLEGKEDYKNFEPHKDKYTFIDCGGAGTIKNFLQCLISLPFLHNGIKNKTVIALFDFDKKGRESIQAVLSSYPQTNDDFAMIIKTKQPLFIKYPSQNIYLSMLTPPSDNNYDFENAKSSFRHQELKEEGEIGVNRQLNLIETILKSKVSGFE